MEIKMIKAIKDWFTHKNCKGCDSYRLEYILKAEALDATWDANVYLEKELDRLRVKYLEVSKKVRDLENQSK
jgi:hypothetical protein